MQQVIEQSGPEGLLRIERTLQEVTWEDALDETWRHVDQAGHLHRFGLLEDGQVWRKGRRRKDRPTHFPTLRWVITRREKCDGWEDHDPHTIDHGHYECLICGEVIEPGHGPGSTMVLVRESWQLTETAIRPDPAWLTAWPGARLEWRRSGAVGTRTRQLPRDEAVALMSRWHQAALDREAEAAATVTAATLGYPAQFATGEDHR